MKSIEMTFDTPNENLAFDEALLDQSEEKTQDEILRFWEPQDYFVVLGYSNRICSEARIKVCKKDKIPIVRRCSGGGTVLQGPGCLNYSLILKIRPSHPTEDITKTNLYILQNHKKALESISPFQIDIEGTNDLAIENLKFSGNAQRRKKNFLLFHGTFLYRFNIQLIEQYLSQPKKQPRYRKNRNHRDFLTNINLSADTIKEALQKKWNATKSLTHWPEKEMHQMIEKKYLTEDWIFRA